MLTEIILFSVILVVFLIDFILKGFKKKSQIDLDRIGKEPTKKNLFSLNYIITRKRNVITFILLAILFKPLIHKFLFPEFLETNSSDRTYIGVNEPAYLLFEGIVSDDIYLFNDVNGKPWFEEDEITIKGEKIFYKIPSKLSKIYGAELHTGTGKPEVQFSWPEKQKFNYSVQIIEIIKFMNDLINFLDKNSYKGFNKDDYILNKDDPKFDIDLDLSKSRIEQWIKEEKIHDLPSREEMKKNFEPVAVTPAPYWFESGSPPGRPEISIFQLFDQTIPITSEAGGTYYTFPTFVKCLLDNDDPDIENSDCSKGISIKVLDYDSSDLRGIFLHSQKSQDKVYTANGERIYFVGLMDNEIKYDLDIMRDRFIGSWDNKFYYYKKIMREETFNFYLGNIFKFKLWVFAISIGFLGLLVFLINDKISAR